MAVVLTDGRCFSVGDAAEPFSIQSISKLLTLMIAIGAIGDEVWCRVGKEPSGTAFNSLVQLEYESGIPRNPFVNAGALVVLDCVLKRMGDRTADAIRDYARVLSTHARARTSAVNWYVSAYDRRFQVDCRPKAWVFGAKRTSDILQTRLRKSKSHDTKSENAA